MTAEAPTDEDILVTARENPEAIDVDKVARLLEHEENQLRNVALMTLGHVASDDPDRVVEHTDAIIERLDDEFPVAESSAAQTLSRIAPEHPEAVRPAIPRLVELLDEDPPLTGYRAGRALGPLLEHAPEDFVEVTDDLFALVADLPDPGIPTEEELEEMDPEIREEISERIESRGEAARNDVYRCYGIREIAVHALVEVSDEEPAAVADRIEELRPVFVAEPPIARSAAMDVVANVAQHDPEAVEPVVDDLIEIAQNDTTQVRSHAIQALGYAGATEAVEPLWEVAESVDEAVTKQLRDLAAETADFLEEAA